VFSGVNHRSLLCTPLAACKAYRERSASLSFGKCAQRCRKWRAHPTCCDLEPHADPRKLFDAIGAMKPLNQIDDACEERAVPLS
jgi:hypothetical protein